MTNKLILTIFSGLVLAYGSVQPARAQSNNKTPDTSAPSATPKLFTGNDKERFNELVDSGFQIRYEIGGKTRTASTWGNKVRNLRTEKVRMNEQVVKVSAVTDDKALEIITHFIIDEKKQRLIVDRRIRNNSAKKVNVQMMSSYVDLKLVIGDRDPESDSEQAALQRIRAGRLIYAALKKRPNPESVDFTDECACDPPPQPCVTIRCKPEERYIPARWYLLPDDRAMLLYGPATIRALPRRPKGAPVNEHEHVETIGLR